jgi:hypothetical protein
MPAKGVNGEFGTKNKIGGFFAATGRSTFLPAEDP